MRITLNRRTPAFLTALVLVMAAPFGATAANAADPAPTPSTAEVEYTAFINPETNVSQVEAVVVLVPGTGTGPQTVSIYQDGEFVQSTPFSGPEGVNIIAFTPLYCGLTQFSHDVTSGPTTGPRSASTPVNIPCVDPEPEPGASDTTATAVANEGDPRSVTVTGSTQLENISDQSVSVEYTFTDSNNGAQFTTFGNLNSDGTFSKTIAPGDIPDGTYQVYVYIFIDDVMADSTVTNQVTFETATPEPGASATTATAVANEENPRSVTVTGETQLSNVTDQSVTVTYVLDGESFGFLWEGVVEADGSFSTTSDQGDIPDGTYTVIVEVYIDGVLADTTTTDSVTFTTANPNPDPVPATAEADFTGELVNNVPTVSVKVLYTGNDDEGTRTVTITYGGQTRATFEFEIDGIQEAHFPADMCGKEVTYTVTIEGQSEGTDYRVTAPCAVTNNGGGNGTPNPGAGSGGYHSNNGGHTPNTGGNTSDRVAPPRALTDVVSDTTQPSPVVGISLMGFGLLMLTVFMVAANSRRYLEVTNRR